MIFLRMYKIYSCFYVRVVASVCETVWCVLQRVCHCQHFYPFHSSKINSWILFSLNVLPCMTKFDRAEPFGLIGSAFGFIRSSLAPKHAKNTTAHPRLHCVIRIFIPKIGPLEQAAQRNALWNAEGISYGHSWFRKIIKIDANIAQAQRWLKLKNG